MTEEDEDKQNYKQIENRNQRVKKIFKGNQMVNGCTLEQEAVFGIINKKIIGQLKIVGEGYVIYYACNKLVIKDIVAKKWQFIHGQFSNITAFDSVQKQTGTMIIAMGQSQDTGFNQTNIIITDNEKQKHRVLPQGILGYISQVELNIEKNFVGALIYQQGDPLPQLNMWNYVKEKLLAVLNLKPGLICSNFKFSIHPTRPGQIVLMGTNFLKLYDIHFQNKKIVESHLPLLPPKIEKDKQFLDHCWVVNPPNSILIVLNKGNRFFIFQNDQLKESDLIFDINSISKLEVPMFNPNIEDQLKDAYELDSIYDVKVKDEKVFQKPLNDIPIEFQTLTATKRGFILGGNNGTICLNELKNNKIQNISCYQMIFEKQKPHSVIYLSSSSSDSYVSIITEGKRGLDYFILNTYYGDTDGQNIQPFFAQGIHTSQISCITVAVSKSIFATCSKDRFVKIWNFYENDNYEKQSIISHKFNEDLTQIALHPIGVYIAIGFKKSIKIHAIHKKSISFLLEIQLTDSQIVNYANGGHYLATNDLNQIKIYESIFYEQIHILTGHQGIIKDIFISEDDINMVSSCASGQLILWNLNNPGQTHSYQDAKTIYNQIAYDVNALKDNYNYKDRDQQNIFIGCSDTKYMVLRKKKLSELVAEFPITDCIVTSFVFSNQLKCIFLGTNLGQIKVCVWPLYEATSFEVTQGRRTFKVPQSYEIHPHACSIKCMRLSDNHEYLFTGDDQGNVSIFKIKNMYNEGECTEFRNLPFVQIMAPIKEKIDQTHNDVYLASIPNVLRKQEIKKHLQFVLTKLEHFKLNEIIKLETQFQKQTLELASEFKKSLDGDDEIKNTMIQESQNQYEDLIEKHEKEQKQHAEDLDNLKKMHSDKIRYQTERNKMLEKEIEEIKQQHSESLTIINKNQKEQYGKLKEDFYEKSSQIQDEYSKIMEQNKETEKNFIRDLEIQENQYEQETEETVTKLGLQIQRIQIDNERLEEENIALIQNHLVLKKEDEVQQKEFEELFKKHNTLRQQNLKNDEDILKMQHQLLDLLKVIESKDETCKQSKEEQINLENFRFMLSEKIDKLKKDKEDLLDKKAQKETNMKMLFDQLLIESNETDKKYIELKKLNNEIKIFENQIQKSELEIFYYVNRITGFQNSIQNIINSQDNPNLTCHKLQDLLDQTSNNDEITKILQKKEISQEDIQQIIKMKIDKSNSTYDDLIKKGRWLTKKLLLIKENSKKMKKIRNDSINAILAQNTKLIEECNLLREENEKNKKELKSVEFQLTEVMRKRAEISRQSENPLQKQLVKRYDQNNKKLEMEKIRMTRLKNDISKEMEDEKPRNKIYSSVDNLPKIKNNIN